MLLKTVATAFNPMDAELKKARLEAAGFHAVITHGLSALSVDGYSMAAGGILVQVPEEEAEDAKELLEAADSPDEPPTE